MDFLDAIKILKSGKQVRRAIWDNITQIWTLDVDKTIVWQKDLKPANISIKQIEADDWEIFENKKTLSDKVTPHLGYWEKDVGESIKEFVDFLRSNECSHSESQILSKAKEVFGDRLC